MMKHDWKYYDKLKFTACPQCGVVRQRNGSNDDKDCRGKVRVTLRESNMDSSNEPDYSIR